MYERRLGKHERRQPRSVGSTQRSQRPAAASVRIRSSNPLKRINTTPAVPPNLHILPIPERALKEGWVFITQNRGLDDGTAALTPEAPARAAATERPEASGGAGSINSRRRSRAANQSAFRRALPDATTAGKKPRPGPGHFMQRVPETGVEPATYALRSTSPNQSIAPCNHVDQASWSWAELRDLIAKAVS